MCDPFRPFRMAGTRIFQTDWDVKNRHEACKVIIDEPFRNNDVTTRRSY